MAYPDGRKTTSFAQKNYDLKLIIAKEIAMATLVRPSTWNSTEAIRLEIVADGMVEEHGSCGLDPLIQQAAAECVLAHRVEDLATVRDCCRRIENRARTLSNGISRAA